MYKLVKMALKFQPSHLHWRSQYHADFLIDALLSCLVVVIFMAIAQLKSDTPRSLSWLKPDHRTHIGAEYDCIARAIRAGRGFSDPFHEPTGPTAWMPPVLPYAMAGVYWAVGDSRDAMTVFMVILQAVGAWLACLIVLNEARRLGKRHVSPDSRTSSGFRRSVGSYCLGIASVSICFSANFFQLFQQTHDTGLLLIAVSVTWLWLVHRQEHCFASHRFLDSSAWGAWGGFVTHCSPVAGGAWLVLAVIEARRWIVTRLVVRDEAIPQLGAVSLARSSTNTSRSAANLNLLAALLPLLVWAAVITPWTLRNKQQLGRWIPIKSNGMYELWQSQCLDANGVLDSEAMSQHPWSSAGEQRRRYQEIGEMAFIREKAIEARAEIVQQPLAFLERVANRATAALIYYMPLRVVDEYYAGGWPILWARLVHPLPLMAIACILLFGPSPLTPRVQSTLLLLGLLLTPYILVSYYDRYAAMLTGLKSLTILYGCSALYGRFFGSGLQSCVTQSQSQVAGRD